MDRQIARWLDVTGLGVADLWARAVEGYERFMNDCSESAATIGLINIGPISHLDLTEPLVESWGYFLISLGDVALHDLRMTVRQACARGTIDGVIVLDIRPAPEDEQTLSGAALIREWVLGHDDHAQRWRIIRWSVPVREDNRVLHSHLCHVTTEVTLLDEQAAQEHWRAMEDQPREQTSEPNEQRQFAWRKRPTRTLPDALPESEDGWDGMAAQAAMREATQAMREATQAMREVIEKAVNT